VKKQTILTTALAFLVGVVPLGFVAQSVSALSVSTDDLLTTNVRDTVNNTVKDVEKELPDTAHATEIVNKATDQVAQKRDTAEDSHGQNGADDNSTKESRFTANKLRVCKKKQAQISSAIEQIGDRGAKQLEVFHTIAERTKAFYTSKGYDTAGYSELAQQVDALYDQSLVAVTSTQSTGDNWSCSGSSPMAQFSAFKDAKQTEIATLKAYKDKVRDLIVFVKAAATSTAQAGGKSPAATEESQQ
jgi:hypothetical protein